MKLKHLSIQNFTSLLHVELRDLPELVILLGKNGSGKSNFIDALALMFNEFGTQLGREVGPAEEYQHLFANYDTNLSPSPQITITIMLTASERASFFGISDDEAVLYEAETIRLGKRLVVRDGQLIWITYEVSYSKPSGEQTFVVQAAEPHEDWEQDQVDEWLKDIHTLLSSSFRVIRTADTSRQWTEQFTERPSILSNERIDRLWGLSQAQGNQRQNWFILARQYESITPSQGRLAGVSGHVEVEEGNLSVPIGLTGEGTQSILTLIDEVSSGPQLIAIEEPETHLHPELVKKVGRLLSEQAALGKQLFVCTHSPFLLDHSSLENCYVVRKESEGTKISPMGDKETLRDTLLNIGMRPSDILFADAILIVDGLSDDIFFNGLSNILETPLANRHIKIIRANGKDNGSYKIEFWAEVGRDAGLPVYVIADKDGQKEITRAIDKGLITTSNCLVLQHGVLEDQYPWEPLARALSNRFGITIEEPITPGNRVRTISGQLRRTDGTNAWKVQLADEMVEVLTGDELAPELTEVTDFLRRLYAEMGV